MSKDKLEQLEVELFKETNGSRFAYLKEKLIAKHVDAQRDAVLAIIERYVREGPIAHWREFLMADAVKLCRGQDQTLFPFFNWALGQPELAYWAVDGLLKTGPASALPTLCRLACDQSRDVEVRAKAIKSLALYADQTFDRNLPADPGHWREDQLPLDVLLQWQRDGFPRGIGHSLPVAHPDLTQTRSALDRAAARLERLLARQRAMRQDAANPDNWLLPASEVALERVNRRWPLPAMYAEFLRKFSPRHVMVAGEGWVTGGLSLYGAEELEARQGGYAFNAVTGQPTADWPANMLVIADDGGDPYCVDLNAPRSGDGDVPVLAGVHGAGRWDFELFATSFLDFLSKVAP
ncbi:MAG: SMI1/KNR4 family protein [Pseudomonadota bacterium]|nr:SMI1/KNR4 family protein [Pseudomonadota bacterium]